MRRLAITAIIIAIIVLTYRLFVQSKTVPSSSVSNESKFTYYNLIYEVKFELPGKYQPEEITYPYGIALYENLSGDFLQNGGIYIKPTRQIPGAKEVFEIFRQQDFEPELKQLGKTFSSEAFVTDQGFDAFKTTVTSPESEVHVVVNTPVAYWFEAKDDTKAFQRVYQSFKKFSPEEAVDIKKAVSVQESFMADLQLGRYDQARGKMSATLQPKFPVELLQTTFDTAKERLARQLRVFSIRTDGQQAIVRSTLEDSSKNKYSFINTILTGELSNWKIDQFVFNDDANGLPYDRAINNVKKEVKREDLLRSQ